MSILLTGANGFIGRHVYERGSDLITVSTIRGKADFYIDNLDKEVDWTSKLDGVEQVIHLANLAHADFSEEDYYKVNVEGSLHLAKEAAKRGVKRFVFVSTVSVHGGGTNNRSPFTPSSSYNALSLAAMSKATFENKLIDICKLNGMEFVIIRPTLVYGPNAPGNFSLLTKIVNSSCIMPFGLMKNRRNFISVQNLSDLLLTCAIHPNAGGHLFLASDMESVSIKDFTNAMAKGLGKKVIQLPVPVSLMRLFGRVLGKSSVIESMVGNFEVESSNIIEVLGWTPPYTMEESMCFLSTKEIKNDSYI